MDTFKNTSSSTLKNIEEKIRPLVQDRVKLIEKSRQNIFYFSKFTLDKEEFTEIFNFVSNIKQTIVRESIDILKSAVTHCVSIPSQNEKEQISTLFSVCFMHYYTTFAYEVANSFDNFYTTEFIQLCKWFNITILNFDLFHDFSKNFYNNIQSVIKRYNYEKIKKLYSHYNYKVVQEPKSAFTNNTDDKVIETLRQHLNKKDNKNNFQKSLLTHLITAKEHLVDLVLETHQKKNYSGVDNLMKAMEQITYSENENKPKSFSNSILSFNLEKEKEINNDMQVDDNSCNYSSEYISTSSVTDENVSFYSKRILSEITKCEVDEKFKMEIDEISQKVDELILDVLINQKENTSINIISAFICYIVEVPANIIKIIPEFSEMEHDLTLRFIVTAKNIYNRVMEIYLSIFDLKLTDVNTFMMILKKRNVQIKYADCFILFFKKLADEIRKEGDNWNLHMEIIFERFIDGLITIWEQIIQENGKKLTHFCIV